MIRKAFEFMNDMIELIAEVGFKILIAAGTLYVGYLIIQFLLNNA